MALIYQPNSSSSYQVFTHSLEKDFEACVVNLSSQLFGENSLYIDIKKKMKNGDIVTIPDGYLIDSTDPNNPSLYIIENEIIAHDPFKHIGIQLLKFATCFDEAKVNVRKFLMDKIEKEASLLKRMSEFAENSRFRNIDNFLDHAVYKPFKALVIIDEARPELHNILEKINADISVLELKTYINENEEFIYQFDTLYDEAEELDVSTQAKGKTLTKEERAKRRERRARCNTIVVPARKEGFESVFIRENRWYAIRIGAAMKERIKYIAVYQKAPVGAITHIAKIQEIKPYKDSGKYEVIFDGKAEEIKPLKVKNSSKAPQGPIYAEKEKIDSAKSLDDLLSY